MGTSDTRGRKQWLIGEQLLIGLAAVAILLSSADHWTTYLCLREPVEGFQVTESNPLSRWLFAQMGLVPGLLLDACATLLALWVVVHTQLIPGNAKVIFLAGVCGWTTAAVVNNYQILSSLGIVVTG